jgi:hypothetical protein
VHTMHCRIKSQVAFHSCSVNVQMYNVIFSFSSLKYYSSTALNTRPFNIIRSHNGMLFSNFFRSSLSELFLTIKIFTT